jgi:hypothetical protein
MSLGVRGTDHQAGGSKDLGYSTRIVVEEVRLPDETTRPMMLIEYG